MARGGSLLWRCIDRLCLDVCIPIADVCPADRMLASLALLYITAWVLGAPVASPAALFARFIAAPIGWVWLQVRERLWG